MLGQDSRKLPGIAVLFLILSLIDVAGIGLIGPFIKLIIDPVLQTNVATLLSGILKLDIQEDQGVLIVAISLILFFLFRAFIGVFVNGIIIGFSESQRYRLKLYLLDKYQGMSLQISSQRNTAEYVHSIHVMTGNYSSNFIYYMLKLSSEVLICLCIIVFLAYQSIVAVTSLFVLVSLVILCWDLFSKGKLTFFGSEINKLSREALQFLQESLDGYQEIRILGKTEAFHTRFDDNSQHLARIQRLAAIFNSIPKFLLELTVFIFVIGLCTAFFLFTDNLDDVIPLLAIFGMATVRLVPSASLIANGIVVMRHNTNTVNLLYDDYTIQDVDGNSKATEPNQEKIDKFKKLEIQDLEFRYDGQSTNILDKVTLAIEAGDAIGIVGPSGSGKSTLSKLILGLLNPVSGSIKVNGLPISSCVQSWQSHLAVIPQEIFLLDDSIEVNISLEFDVKKVDRDRLDMALLMASLSDFVNSLPDGVETKVGEKGAFLSGGQRQRLILARAFYHGRDFLIMDEATSALDSNTEAKIVSEIMSLKKKITMIVIAHRLSTIKHCDHVLTINKGQVTYQKGNA